MKICSECEEFTHLPHTHHGWGTAIRTAARNISAALGLLLLFGLLYMAVSVVAWGAGR